MSFAKNDSLTYITHITFITVNSIHSRVKKTSFLSHYYGGKDSADVTVVGRIFFSMGSYSLWNIDQRIVL